MSLAVTKVLDISKSLETGDGSEFFSNVADNIDWIVAGTHPLAGHYHSKADFAADSFEKRAEALPQGTQFHVEHALVSGDWAVVGLPSLATAKNGLRFDKRLAGFAGSDTKRSLRSAHISIRLSWRACSKRIQFPK
jgi:ketosteroid isomerase-like protein